MQKAWCKLESNHIPEYEFKTAFTHHLCEMIFANNMPFRPASVHLREREFKFEKENSSSVPTRPDGIAWSGQMSSRSIFGEDFEKKDEVDTRFALSARRLLPIRRRL